MHTVYFALYITSTTKLWGEICIIRIFKIAVIYVFSKVKIKYKTSAIMATSTTNGGSAHSRPTVADKLIFNHSNKKMSR